MKAPAFNQPFDFQMHTCIHKAEEMLVCMFEGESIRVYEVLRDKKVKFSGEGH